MQVRNLLTSISVVAVFSFATAAYAMSAKDFVQKASVANEFEIESSDLALHRSQDSKIKEFAQHMVDDHTKVGDNLKETLQNADSGLQPDETLDEKHQDMLNKLDETSAQDFDREYVSIQTKAHKEAVSLFSSYAKSGKDKALKRFAAKTLPTLKKHLKLAEQLKTSE